MDISADLQSFEESISSYTGDDPLDPWDRFYEDIEKKVSTEDTKGLSLVLDRLVQRFLQDDRYSNDIRYVNHCIKCASFYSEPIKVYSYIHSKGIGTTTAALYVAWAQQFEQRGLHEQADSVYQTAIENQAKPSDTLLQQYRMFQSRTSRGQTGFSDGPSPLQNSQLVNQMSSHKEPGPQCKEPEGLSQLREDITVRIISRSENTGVNSSNQSSVSSVRRVSMYCKETLECEGSELCFEEVRATKYFFRRKQEEECRELEAREKLVREQEEDVQRRKRLLEDLDNNLESSGSLRSTAPTQQGHCNITATRLNPEFLLQSSRQPPLLSSNPTLGPRLNWATDFNPESERPPRQRSLQRAPAIDPQSTIRPSLPSVLGLREQNASPPSSTYPQPSALQAPVFQTQIEQSTKSFNVSYSAPLSPACAPVEQSEAPHQGSHSLRNKSLNHLAMSFHNHIGRDQNMYACEAPEAEPKLDVSQGATGNLSHITPNTSLGMAQATPSRVLPSPTVNTREALDVIMDMFQAPTLLQDDPFSSMLQAEKSFDAGYNRTGSVTSFNKPHVAAPFAIFQDENDKEICSAAVAVDKPRAPRPLVELPVSKQEKTNETPAEMIPDESTMWGARYNSLNSLAACPNSTGDFALLAHLVSTPFQSKASYSRDSEQDQENDLPRSFIGPEEKPYVRQPTKLSPIIEQSPSDDKLSETTLGPMRVQGYAEQGTIVGEGLALAQRSLAACSITEVHHAPAVLSFRDQTLVHPEGSAMASSPPKASGSDWDVYRSPEQFPTAACHLPQPPPEAAVRRSQSFTLKSNFDVYISPKKAPEPAFDVPMSPECVPKPEWLLIQSPEAVIEQDLDAFMSPQQAPQKRMPMSPEPKFCMDVPMSPAQIYTPSMDVPMSPDQSMKVSMDVPMSPAAGTAAVHLVSDPWDEELISRLLATLSPPLTSHPDYISWECKVPNISPNVTIKMGHGSLRVDRILGQGAFATVYQATDLSTSQKMILKVQKPANPWEFYINSQLNARLQPSVRHLFSNISSAHVFQNGSVLLGELHNCGTLLNAVNLYKNLSDKVMPQPLVIYFTICILHMVEQLHGIHIVHADIKPDNFLLGERFLDNTCFEPENLDHGLSLIDLGQSIDMTLFPEGTAFTAKCMTSGFQCTEMLSGRPWNYQTDYFGIAGTVYCMIFGTYMQVKNENGVWKTNAVFRRNPHSELWIELFHTLLNVPDCHSLPCLRGLRSRLCSVLQQNYRNKLASLKTRLVIQLLESKSARR